MRTEIPQLNCLVYATHDQYHQQVSTWLGFSKRVGSVTSVETDNAVAKFLASASSDLAIIVVSDNSQSLPACLQQHAELPVLVLTENKEPRDLAQWFQQGATDVVSIQNTVTVQHAISRLIDEHSLKQRLAVLEQQVQDTQLQNQYLKQILERGSRFMSNRVQSSTTATQSPHVEKTQTVALRTIKGRYNFKHLNKTQHVEPQSDISKSNTRANLLNRFQTFLQSNKKPKRYTALLVRVLKQSDEASPGDSAKRSHTPTLHKAAQALKARLREATVMGQLNDNALVIVQDTDKENTSRDTANQVRDLLSSLEGISDTKKDVRINTLTLRNSGKLSAEEAVERLESL